MRARRLTRETQKKRCKKSFSPLVSATIQTALDDPVIDLIQDRQTAYVGVAEGRMAYFRFALSVESHVYFELDKETESQLDSLHAYLRKDGTPDLNEPKLSQQLSLTGNIDLVGDIVLDAGSWVLGIYAKDVQANSLPGQSLHKSSFKCSLSVPFPTQF
jgi:hypothetical protein